jgi:UDP-GlcNAc:undecaprenyl-phosphate GlcNAc-1-phosphate transferase
MILQFLPVFALLASLALCLNAQAVGERLGVMARPDGRRKVHAKATPQIGGIAILSGFVLWLVGALLFPAQIAPDPILLTVLLTAGGLGIVGFVDDRHEIPPLSRILLLLVFAGAAFALDPQLISPTLNWKSFSPTDIPVWAYLPLMAVTTVGLVNAVNMADGQNGLVGGMFVVWTACLVLVTSGTLALMAGMLCVFCAMFLFFNLRGKMFLGDCGSYAVTFAIGLMVTLAHARGEVSLETVIVWFFIPVADCLRLMITRKLQGRSPFEGGRDHFHHRLIDSMGARRSAAIYVAAVAASSLCATLAPRFALVFLCVLSGFYFSFARLSERHVHSDDADVPEENKGNVLPMSGHARERK